MIILLQEQCVKNNLLFYMILKLFYSMKKLLKSIKYILSHRIKTFKIWEFLLYEPYHLK